MLSYGKRMQRLKIQTIHFEKLVQGVKTAEFRKRDRDVVAGDFLLLCEINGAGEFTGRAVVRMIGDVTDLSEWAPGYGLLSFAEMEQQPVYVSSRAVAFKHVSFVFEDLNVAERTRLRAAMENGHD